MQVNPCLFFLGLSATVGLVLLVELFGQEYFSQYLGLLMSITETVGVPFVTYGLCCIMGGIVTPCVRCTPPYIKLKKEKHTSIVDNTSTRIVNIDALDKDSLHKREMS